MWAKASFTLRLSSAIDLPLCLSRSPKRSFCSFSGRVEIACFIFFFGGGGGGGRGGRGVWSQVGGSRDGDAGQGGLTVALLRRERLVLDLPLLVRASCVLLLRRELSAFDRSWSRALRG